MPERKTRTRARRSRRQGKAASTQAGEHVREEMHHAREGKHRVKGKEQAIAIGLAKAREDGVEVPARGRKKAASRKRASSSRKRAPARRRASR